jgi:hypothetical protein
MGGRRGAGEIEILSEAKYLKYQKEIREKNIRNILIIELSREGVTS